MDTNIHELRNRSCSMLSILLVPMRLRGNAYGARGAEEGRSASLQFDGGPWEREKRAAGRFGGID